MSEQERVRVEIAFDGGQILGGFAAVAAVEQLEREQRTVQARATPPLSAADHMPSSTSRQRVSR